MNVNTTIEELPAKSTNIIKNMLDKIDRLAEEYRTTKTTDALVAYIHFRSDCIELISRLWIMGVYPTKGKILWNTQSYMAVVTDELDIFHNGGKAVPQEEFVRKLKKWREGLKK